MSVRARLDKNNVVLKTGAADAASNLEARLKKLLRAWSDVILAKVGPSAKMKRFSTFAYEGLEEGKEFSTGWSTITDKRLPPHAAIDMTGETQADGSTTLRLRLALPYEWVGFTSDKVRDSFKFDVTLKGDVDQLHLSATKHVKALMDVLGPVLAVEEQNKQAMTRFKGALQLLLDAIRASLVKSGVQDTARIHVKPTGGSDVNLIQVEDGVPFWPADLHIQRLKSKKTPSRGNLEQQDSSLATIHAAVLEAFESFDQGGVRAVLSARYDDHSSEKEYTNYFYLYFKDGPDPKIRIAREGTHTMKTDDRLRAATIKLAHENPSLRKHLLPLLTKTASALDGWEKKVKPGSRYPVVYVREHEGKTYRVAPSIRGDKWTLDVHAITGWERHHPKDGDTPEEAASFLR